MFKNAFFPQISFSLSRLIGQTSSSRSVVNLLRSKFVLSVYIINMRISHLPNSFQLKLRVAVTQSHDYGNVLVLFYSPNHPSLFHFRFVSGRLEH